MAQEAVDLIERQTRFRDFDLDAVAAAGAHIVGNGDRIGVCGAPDGLDPGQHLVRQRFARQAARRQARGSREAFDDQAMVGHGVAYDACDERDQAKRGRHREQLQQEPEPIGGDLQAELAQLYAQVMALVVDEAGLTRQEHAYVIP